MTIAAPTPIAAGRTQLVVGFGGTTRAHSSTNRALALALEAADEAGLRTQFFGGDFLARLPHYRPEDPERTPEARTFVEAVRAADGVVIATPGYHGGVSGLVKNAIDLLDDLRDDARPYLDGRAVGCIVTASGWQACGSTLGALRSIVHALRGWPTPLGATLNTARTLFAENGDCLDERSQVQLALVGAQVAEFALLHRRAVVAAEAL